MVLGDTPIGSGVRFLPTVLANFVMGIVSGGLVTQYGYYNPWLFFGSITTIVSSAVFTTWDAHESNAMIIGIQILLGIGIPMLIQMVSNFLSPFTLENSYSISPSVTKKTQLKSNTRTAHHWTHGNPS